MKTLKLRNKEEVTEAALLDDMKAFLSSYREAHRQEEPEDLPLYKQIKADVEERPLTVRRWSSIRVGAHGNGAGGGGRLELLGNLGVFVTLFNLENR